MLATVFSAMLVGAALGVTAGPKSSRSCNADGTCTRLWEPPVPGTDAMSEAYNLFAGQFFVVEQSQKIGTFVPPENATSANTIQLGSEVYTVVDALAVTSAYSCEKIGETYATLVTASASDMKSHADTKSYGFDHTATVSAGLPFGEVSTDIKTALLFGNTNYMSESRSHSESDFSYRSAIEYNARAFDAKVTWNEQVFVLDTGFIADFNAVIAGDAPTRNKKVFGFFQKWGSHVILEAYFGAKCHKEVYYKAGHTANSEARVEQTVKNHEGTIFGISFGSSDSGSSSTEKDDMTGVTYTMVSERCDGIVQNNGCNQEQDAVSLQPIVMQATPKPVWTLEFSTLSEDATLAFEESVVELLNAQTKCSEDRCNHSGGKGICILKPSFWQDVENGNFDGVIDNGSFDDFCVCSEGGGKNCAPIPVIDTLVFGQLYHFQNQYDNWGAGYLDVRNPGCAYNVKCVSTATSPNRDQGSGVWEIQAPAGTVRMGDVMNGDLVSLKNRYKKNDGGYLDTRGENTRCGDNYLEVTTAESSNRESNSGLWRIVVDKDDLAEYVTVGAPIQLINQYESDNGGGYLDICGGGCEGNVKCVSTTRSQYRANSNGESTVWRTWDVPEQW